MQSSLIFYFVNKNKNIECQFIIFRIHMITENYNFVVNMSFWFRYIKLLTQWFESSRINDKLVQLQHREILKKIMLRASNINEGTNRKPPTA